MHHSFIIFALPLVAFAQQETPTAFSDAEIIHILTTANDLEIQAGKLASEKAVTREARSYAKQMVNDHTQKNQDLAALAKKLRIAPKENAQSKSLRGEGQAALKRLQGLQGESFDREYIASQLSMHQRVLKVIDQSARPHVRNPELRAMIEKTRPAIQIHLQHARRMHGGPSAADNRENADIRSE